MEPNTITQLPPRTANKHVSGLALLRGVAALSVGLFHFTGAVLPKLHVDAVASLFASGWLGVEVFFVISGFVIPYSLLGKGYTIRDFLPYMAKRITRINPPAYLALILVVAQWYLIDYFISHEIKYTKGLSAMQLAHNVFFTIPFSEYGWIIGIFWTLAIEFQFYIIIGLLFNTVFERTTILPFIVAFLLLGLVQYLPFRTGDNFFHFSALFAMGGISLYRKLGKVSIPIYLSLLLAFTIVAYLEIGIYHAIAGLLTALSIQYVSLENSVTRFLGKISYSFYLTHALVGSTCEFVLVKFISTVPTGNRLGMQAICLLVAIGAAYIFYLVVEQPFMRLAGRIRA
ncbi:acyltransferase family protein [Hymenobacter sp. HMF4947]|uniref:Acyltransferase family protein n=1 Tax=Hymenobacter ginkgonis TaxID=2682976 RepID=A0A7K1TKR1_9BACT|nr:acyltransferase [Hymenobacter ginkgonis]MVN78995.1 acyltransferase family protein [Hymenobacter ginkgonis]